MKLICSIILVFLLFQSVRGQELYGTYLNHEQGLLSNECYDINYDENGYLIVGTPYGPMKYNGEKFIPICTNLSMERRVMYDFEKDARGNIYLFNSKNELFKLKNDKAIWIGPKNYDDFCKKNATIKNERYNLIFNRLYCIDNDLYISANSDFLKFSFKTKKIRKTHEDKTKRIFLSYNSKAEFPFFKSFSGRLSKDGRVAIHFPESNQIFQLKGIKYDSREDRITIGKTTYLLICMKLFKKEGNRVTLLNFKEILFMKHFHNRLWLCTLNGLIELDTEGNFIHNHFKGEVIGGVAPLNSGGIAVSFNKKGVFISSDINNRIYYNFTPTSAARINKKNLIGSLNGELFKYTDYKMETLAQSDPYSSQMKRSYHEGIFDISLYKKSILLTSSFGISVFTPEFKKIKDIKDPRNSFFGLFINGENLYFIYRGGMIKKTWGKLDYPDYHGRFFIPGLQCHARLNDSLVFLGTATGLFKLNTKTDRFSHIDLFKKELRITGIHVIEKKKLLVSTRFDGIYLINKNKIVRKISVPCISVSSFLWYRGQLIIRGNDGIYILPFNKSKKNIWVKFFSGECENMFILDEHLLIAYKKDMIIKRLSDYKLSYKPTIFLNQFLLGDVDMNRFPGTIPPNKSISLDLDILQFDANKLDLFYKLKGENTISQQIEGTKINFDALKSGSYELEIFPVIDKKIQFNNSKTFRFTIEETFWESTVFYIITIVLVISMLFTLFLLVNLRRRKRRAERAELESKMNEYKLLAVKAQVNPHFLSNGLAAIQALILKGDNDLAAQYLAKFSFLMRKTLYYSEKQFITVKQELQLVDTYLELELLRFRNRFKIHREIGLTERQLNEFQFPSLLLQPILENAIWHGLKFQENDPELVISFRINQNQELVVQISDNGPGFNSSNQSEEHLSKGNQLITERIDALNQQFQKPVASLEVISSKSGTSVIFMFSSLLYQHKQE